MDKLLPQIDIIQQVFEKNMLTPVRQIFEQIRKAGNILIIAPSENNGDNIASALAMFLYLKKIQKKSAVVIPEYQTGKKFSFLPSFHDIRESIDNIQKFVIALDISKTKAEQVKYATEDNKLKFIIIPKNGFFSAGDIESYSGGFKYDLIFSLGCQDLESLGVLYENNVEFFYKTPLINIDHDSANEEFGQINLINLVASSSAEILYYLFKDNDPGSIDEDIATCLLAGMIAGTGNFKLHNITPQTLEAAAQLIAAGARRDEINNQLYRSRSFSVLKLWGRALARLSGALDNKLVWTTLSYNDFTKSEAAKEDLDDIIDELIVNIPQVRVITLFYESLDGDKPVSNVLIYTLKSINLQDILKKYGSPIKTKNLYHLTTGLNLQEATTQIVTSLEEYLQKTSF